MRVGRSVHSTDLAITLPESGQPVGGNGVMRGASSPLPGLMMRTSSYKRHAHVGRVRARALVLHGSRD